MSNTYRNIFIVLAVITLGISGVYVYGILLVKKTTEEVSIIRNDIEKKTEQRGSFQSLTNLLEYTAADRQTLSEYYIQGGIVSFLETLETLAREGNIQMDISTVAVVPSDAGVDDTELLSVDLNFSGEWSDLFRYISLVETLPQGVITRSTNLQFVPRTESRFAQGENAPYVPWRGSMQLYVWKLK